MNEPRTPDQTKQADHRRRPREQRLIAAVVSQYLHKLVAEARA